MDLNEYKKSITKQLELEKFLLTKIDADEKIKNKNFLKKRINKRIEIIESELNQEIEEEPVETEKEVNEKPVVKETNSIKSPETNQKNPRTEKKQKEIEEKVSNTNKQSSVVINSNDTKSKPEQIEPQVNKIKNPKLYNEIISRSEEYRKAVEYFVNIESLKQAEDARSKVLALNKALESMEQGKSVDEIDLPIAITPDYICNMSKQERLNNFSIIIKDFSRKKNELNMGIKNSIDAYNKLDQRTQKNLVIININLFTELLEKSIS